MACKDGYSKSNMACRDGYSNSNTVYGVGGKWLVEMVTLNAILFMVPPANLPKTSSRNSVRGGAHNRDYPGLWRTDFDERPPDSVSIYAGSNGRNGNPKKILNEKILPEQWSTSCM